MSLFQYLPEIIRTRDQLNAIQSTQGPLELFLEAWEDDYDTQYDLILKLADLIDPDKVGADYIIHLALLFGEVPGPTWSEFRRREYVKNIVRTLKTKATAASWKRRALEAGYGDLKFYELWKSDLNEHFDYVRFPDGSHPYKSARVDIGPCASQACESICQLGCESTCEDFRESVYTPSQARAILEGMGDVRPIHVLVRPYGVIEDLSDSVDDPSDSVAVHACGVFNDSVPSIDESLVTIRSCTSHCESICQTCCECGNETGPCTNQCQITCEGWCELNCQTTCQLICQTACEVTCESVCMTDCQSACQSTQQ